MREEVTRKILLRPEGGKSLSRDFLSYRTIVILRQVPHVRPAERANVGFSN
jgi:hypothetical protein